jgi:hypothetical protein
MKTTTLPASDPRPSNLATANGAEVAIALLQSAARLPGGKTETTLNCDRIPGLKMHVVTNPDGILLTVNSKTAWVPVGNIIIAVLK